MGIYNTIIQTSIFLGPGTISNRVLMVKKLVFHWSGSETTIFKFIKYNTLFQSFYCIFSSTHQHYKNKAGLLLVHSDVSGSMRRDLLFAL